MGRIRNNKEVVRIVPSDIVSLPTAANGAGARMTSVTSSASCPEREGGSAAAAACPVTPTEKYMS